VCDEHFRLSLSCVRRGRGLGFELRYDPALYRPEDLGRLSEEFRALLADAVAALDAADDGDVVPTAAGRMRVGDYLPTRTFELAVHTADLATALDVPLDVPATAAAQALQVVADLAVADGLAGHLLLAATGRPGLPAGFSVL
ncbi:MAG TPA: maleylpyruvate isomerase N-terminal domain-containing protein, partial [Acidimicrobiales bacterium]